MIQQREESHSCRSSSSEAARTPDSARMQNTASPAEKEESICHTSRRNGKRATTVPENKSTTAKRHRRTKSHPPLFMGGHKNSAFQLFESKKQQSRPRSVTIPSSPLTPKQSDVSTFTFEAASATNNLEFCLSLPFEEKTVKKADAGSHFTSLAHDHNNATEALILESPPSRHDNLSFRSPSEAPRINRRTPCLHETTSLRLVPRIRSNRRLFYN